MINVGSGRAAAQQKLQDRLNEIQFEDDFDMALYVRLASRLAALGDHAAFLYLPVLFKEKYAETYKEILHDAISNTIFDLKERVCGDALAQSIIEAQDWAYWFWFDELYVPSYLNDMIEGLDPEDPNCDPEYPFEELYDKLMEAVSEIGDLDQEAKEFLQSAIETYPVMPEDSGGLLSLFHQHEEELVKADGPNAIVPWYESEDGWHARFNNTTFHVYEKDGMLVLDSNQDLYDSPIMIGNIPLWKCHGPEEFIYSDYGKKYICPKFDEMKSDPKVSEWIEEAKTIDVLIWIREHFQVKIVH